MYSQGSVSNLKLFVTLMVGIAIGFTFSQVTDTSKYEIPNIGNTVRTQDVWTQPNPSEEIKEELESPIDSTTDSYEDEDLEHDVWSRSPREYKEHADPIFNEINHNENVPQQIANNKFRYYELNTTIADKLYDEVKVLCWILTGPANHKKKAIHVKNTWGSRCNKLIFMSSEEDEELGAVKLPGVGEGRGQLWKKTREAFKYIYENYIDEYDWFLKADDDTYVIVENLRLFLYPMSSEAPVYFGCKFKPHVRQGYMSGGAGYVLSRTAVKRFVELGHNNRMICRKGFGGSEDSEMGRCLQNVGVVAGDSRDDLKRGRFFPTQPSGHLKPKDKSSWYWRYIFYKTEDGLDCCSNYAISFHYIHPDNMYVMDYLIYQLKPFGILPSYLELPPKKNMEELLNKWRNEESDNPL
ncbi:glycoprotein-N-acetylgalactosamine 3-beta-galactosyltransferase 1-like [Musca vetustissima]|uniref:glycoprotein-N-acetylgalactosamine 3-beta-galactosyltransferase 1-like n=1 Tax=Musca vetustissima TaxID=27455 RepID=UPI002AB70F70|nr:glycoprotein-N-acetylgalactosamine 3-beta-galactosyltransferase 1-like [Musca vetustissima]